MATTAETEGPSDVNQTDNTVDKAAEAPKAPLIIVQQVPQPIVQPTGGYAQQGGYAQAGYGQDPLYDDPSNVWCFLIIGLFIPIVCCFGLCFTDPNAGPRTRNAYNTLKWVTIIYWVFVFIVVIASSASS